MTTIRVSGPFFATGNREAVMLELRDEIGHDAGAQALADVHHNLNASIRHPTPYYETQITLDQHGADAIVHDRGVIYGPWLEGTGSRNRTTRFKGYASFRRAVQTLVAKVPGLCVGPAQRAARRLS